MAERTLPLLSDPWREPGDDILSFVNANVYIPFTKLFPDITDETLNIFITKAKRLYHQQESFRGHMSNIINYFLKYFDHEKELLSTYLNLKLQIDRMAEYSIDNLMQDIDRYIVIGLHDKVASMNTYNYVKSISNPNPKRNVVINPKLHYTDDHGRVIMKTSLFINLVIPVVTHFIYTKRIEAVDETLMQVFESIIYRIYEFDNVNIIHKIMESTKRATNNSYSQNQDNWKTQSIIGYNTSTHIEYCIQILVINVFCKYDYNSNFVFLNNKALRESAQWKVTRAPYEFTFIPTISHKTEDGKVTEADKFESRLSKEDEAHFIQTMVNGNQVVKFIENKFGEVSQDELDYYLNYVGEINLFQKNLVGCLFYKYFGDPDSVKALNNINIVKLMICGKRMLLHLGLTVMPYFISGCVVKFPHRKSISKKESEKIVSSTYYKQIQDTYKSEKIEQMIMTVFASILTADFTIIDYDNQELTGTRLNTSLLAKDKISEEIITCINLINMQ